MNILRALRAHLRLVFESLPSGPREAAPGGAAMVLATALLGTTLCVTLVAQDYHLGFTLLNQFGRSLNDGLLENITYAGDTLFGLTVMLIFSRRYPQVLWTAVLAALIATLLSHGMKFLFDALRPPAVLDVAEFHLLGPRYMRHSFPSGHTTTAFVVACSFAAYWRDARAQLLVLGLATAVGLSRVMIGAHWPADVAAGAATGAVSVLLAVRLSARWKWGQRPRGHLLLVAALAACAIAQLVRPATYPLAADLAVFTSVAALAACISNYLLLPRWLARRSLPTRTAQRDVGNSH